MITIIGALALGAVVGLASQRRELAAISAAICAVACHLALGAVSEAVARTPPVFAWESTLAAVANGAPVWATALAAAGAAVLAATFGAASTQDRPWTPDMPDRRTGADRRRDGRGPDRRKNAWEDVRGGI